VCKAAFKDIIKEKYNKKLPKIITRIIYKLKFTEKVQQVNIPPTSVGRKVFIGQNLL